MMKNNSLALDGIRILSLEHVLAVPYGTMVLADLGAEVIKVERPGTGDDSRQYGPFLNGERVILLVLTGIKKVLPWDYSTEDGREILRAWSRSPIVIVENFRPGALHET
jgi:crotonobetainyl-CoA:carnitine CoA-transferase CaiB-like acyl-CoA transferase